VKTADGWQARMIRATERDRLGPIVLSVLAESSTEMEMFIFLCLVYGEAFKGLRGPHLVSAAKISKRGCIVADVKRQGRKTRNAIIFVSEQHMETEFRKLCDRLKLADAERIEFFNMVQKWVVADYRLDPRMDRNDPDAKRLTLH
jgi:hypothetical protein